MEDTKYKFECNIIISGEIKVCTGIMIGGAKDSMKIGGVDTPVIKHPQTNKPYIPGSSLKGKMRTQIEYFEGLTDGGQPHSNNKGCEKSDCIICVVFGTSKNRFAGTTRLIVRDATIKENKNGTKSYSIENKTENTINRLLGKAEAPREFERVAAGAVFSFELVYTIFNENDDIKHFSTIFKALAAVEDSYLGASGTRGYGKVKFKITKIEKKTVDTYQKGEAGQFLITKHSTPSELLTHDFKL